MWVRTGNLKVPLDGKVVGPPEPNFPADDVVNKNGSHLLKEEILKVYLGTPKTFIENPKEGISVVNTAVCFVEGTVFSGLWEDRIDYLIPFV